MSEYATAPALPLPKHAHRPEPIEPPTPDPAEPDTTPDPVQHQTRSNPLLRQSATHRPSPPKRHKPAGTRRHSQEACNSDMVCALNRTPSQQIYVLVTKPAHLLPAICRRAPRLYGCRSRRRRASPGGIDHETSSTATFRAPLKARCPARHQQQRSAGIARSGSAEPRRPQCAARRRAQPGRRASGRAGVPARSRLGAGRLNRSDGR